MMVAHPWELFSREKVLLIIVNTIKRGTKKSHDPKRPEPEIKALDFFLNF